MLPNEKQLKSLMKKIKATAEKKYEEKQSKISKQEEIVETSEVFQEMKKLPFTE